MSETAKRLLVWTLRAWPVLALLLLAVCHLVALSLLPGHVVLVNKLTGTTMQVVGGLVVLHAVDSNLGLFRKQNLFSVVLSWFRDFPLIRRSHTISLQGVASSAVVGSATLTVERKVTTVEERLTELERQLKEVHAAIQQQRVAVLQRIEEVKIELNRGIATNQAAISELSARIEIATVGGFKQQAFGVMLAIYGAFVSVFA